MLKLDNVTLVLMSSVDIDKCIKVLELSSKDIEFADIKFITHEEPLNLPNKIKYCYIDKINSIDEYSYSMIYKLENYIDTDYALVIQTDGFIVNPNMWREEFLQYDYIGAPFQLPRDNFSYRDAFGNIFRVGNGGFSLRSKKLIKLANEIGLKWKSFHGYYNEDGFICAMYRHKYEDNGCKFAPLDVAKYFSHEAYIPEIEGITPFGFHGKGSNYNNLIF